MASERTPDQKIADARRVEEFLRDEVIYRAIQSLEEKYIEEMITAKQSDERARAQGKIHAVRGFASELRAIMLDADHELALVQLQEKFEEQRKKGLLA